MEFTPAGRRWAGPPLAWQILGLLLGGLVVAQLVTLVLTLLLPPAPQKRYDLTDVARALSGDDVTGALQRTLEVDAPEVNGPGWLTSERSRHELARLLGRADGDVLLYFYTPLPFAGTARGGAGADAQEPVARATDDKPRARVADYLLAQAGPSRPPPGGDRGAGLEPAAGPNPNGRPLSNPGDLPGAGTPFGAPSGGPIGMPGARANVPGGTTSPNAPPTSTTYRLAPPTSAVGGLQGPAVDDRPNDSIMLPRTGSRALPNGSSLGGGAVPGATARSTLVPRIGLPASGNGGVLRLPDPDRNDVRLGGAPATSAPAVVPAAQGRDADAARTRAAPVSEAAPRKSTPSSPAEREKPSSPTVRSTMPLAATTAPRGLFGLAPAPFVEGDFLAAVTTRDGWVVVQPVAEPFPNSWQRRVLLWFAISFAVIAPFGWLFARRLVRPIAGFAIAAERLGRDPTASVMALEGPAEVGRAAHAFNRMQSRLRSFVDDRTAMIGAISHDLRTPLTRLRFRIEEVGDELRDEPMRTGMLHEVEEMEAMITSVLAFIRDGSDPGTRERLDLATIVEDIVEDAVFVGSDVRLTMNEHAVVEVDAIAMRRMLANLVDNAVKYGERARVRLFTDRTEAIAEVVDDGPGLADDELERVFEPFYRTQVARASDKQGSGLGLAVCRSIARAHGGDVRLLRRRDARGLVAQVRIPLAYGTRGVKAA